MQATLRGPVGGVGWEEGKGSDGEGGIEIRGLGDLRMGNPCPGGVYRRRSGERE